MSLTILSVDASVDCSACGCNNYLGGILSQFCCTSCKATNPLSPEAWADLLAPALYEQVRQGATRHVHDLESLKAAARTVRTPVACRCGGVIPEAALAGAGAAGFVVCAACGAKLLVRAVPSSYVEALPGVSLLVGEEFQPKLESAYDLDGEPQVFWMIHDGRLPKVGSRPSVHWCSLVSSVSDLAGGLFAIGDDGDSDGPPVVFALDMNLRTRWVQRTCETDSGRLLSAPGRLVFWRPDEACATALDPADGSVVGPVGTAALDFRHALAVALDPVDGSYVVQTKSFRLARFTASGEAVPIWPPHKGFLGITRVEKPRPFDASERLDDAPTGDEYLDDYPAQVGRAALAFSPDGTLLIWGSHRVTAFDRAGKRGWSVALPIDLLIPFGPGVAVQSSEKSHAILLVGPDGKVTTLVPHAPDVAGLVAGAEGTLLALGDGVVQRFSSDGRELRGPSDL